MTEDEIRVAFLKELTSVAPDLDLDSMDILNLVTALHVRFGIDVAEPDYPKIATLASAVPFLAARMG
ncbi:acyl carrier protein [Roseobacter sp. HKCCD9010]|uniref:acyl carrier protein n=1 Tax=unclassified Roseobacter TaxID=196798 RepID=UPI001492F585|nr:MULTISPECIES: acyl carrier protein [unclassified Roseobacter]MBF9050451.1 acyl carrier protein [Rhodobacterales bacterium HKCCD4356]NNV12132.1 acyl carrier protein [Roseobacter sp. HKCCD7357]NNV17146.1 acyl carrier protein [Roseobacter sp. HKCCD8768]NNV26375.1 acyl carrier protein [Roseobacter sp. HKCCD8192]NNV30870.1 acyl carrier protein [Roseobacter sp. HKCCD9061]